MASTNKNKNKKSELELEYESEEDEDNEEPSIGKDDKFSSETSQDQDMITSSQHYFGSIEDGFSISIIENMKEEYGLFVWPSSIILAEYVWQQKSRFSKANVVELGAGTSLPGLVAAKVGADVTLTDDANRLEVLDNMRRVCNINGVKCRVAICYRCWDSHGAYGMHLSSVCAQTSFLELMFSMTHVPSMIFLQP
ncbi:methyltransferase-like protein 22 isoform X4 [Sesamum indicum]|uniref:Methyltransferase-like protein 22 isoform X4 n=1 Tax=Sesamum indicum TaxID=4182 RepID=A0A6I9U6V6_SESIN|nr:methyltransferase-like protein 22 isoform X4 [Sesamum indicum]XP_011089599.1 methyltransferase-like protein 22 isoform X4 [Sesamum indicum]